MKLVLYLLLTFGLVAPSFSQIRMNRLEVAKGETYSIMGSDILVIDTLIMRDSSTIVLSHEKKDNFIHCKYLTVGKAAKILGVGEDGTPGKNGARGAMGTGPCRDGQNGRGATGGNHGDNGSNLFIYCTDIKITGHLTIDLTGGNGGDGGNGGGGGGGSPGTTVCAGGNGGMGANGATGGNGGNGGNLLIDCKNCPDIRSWLLTTITVRSYGGNPGVGGDGGPGGMAGLNPNGNNALDGKPGARGKDGTSGIAGKNGAINFERNSK